MKVLMVSQFCTHPHDEGNRQRIYRECCQMMDAGWQIDFLYFGSRINVDIEEMKRFFGKEHFFCVHIGSIDPRYQLKAMIRQKCERNRFTRYLPIFYNKDEWYYREVEERIQTVLHRQKYDVIWLQYLNQSKVLENIGTDVFKVIDTHDVFAHRNLMFLKQRKVSPGFYITRNGEREALARADLVIAIQNQEEEYFNKLMKNQKTECITIGDMVEFHGSKEGNEKRFGFVGTENPPNVFAVKWLVEKVLPLVREMEPEYECIIAGRICGGIPDNPYYSKMGKLERLQQYYDRISFAINPIQNGTGLNIKGIEALSYGKPLLSTTVGARGLEEAEIAGAMIVCGDERFFAEQIVYLMRNRQKRIAMRKETEKFIYEYNKKNKKALIDIENRVFERIKK